MSRGERPRRERGAGYYRVWLEVFALVVAPASARYIERLEWPGVVLVTLATAALILLLRLLPDTDASAWPRLLPPGRAGRRAEVYHLSWQLGTAGESAPAAKRRLLGAIAQLRSSAQQGQLAELDALAARLEAAGDARTVSGVVGDLEAYLDSLARDRAYPTTRSSL